MTINSTNSTIMETEGTVSNLRSSPMTTVQRFYNGKSVMITGATGFLGKILIEKLLRSCPGVEKLYLLVREKKGKNKYQRMSEIFDEPVFDRLRELQPKFQHKVVLVTADLEAAGLGLTRGDRQELIDNVNIIFHGAATVKFDEPLRKAMDINVSGPLNILRLARDIKNLDVLIHVSTAFSNCHLSHIEEKFYPNDGDCQLLFEIIDKLPENKIDDLMPTILGKWPNTYTFTKALAEKELRANASGIPFAIFRPAIVTNTYKEPISSWLDNMYGPTGIVIGFAMGLIRVMHCDQQVTADLVPVDSVVNCLVVAAAKVNSAFKTGTPPADPPIYNYVSSPENKITWGTFIRNLVDIVHQNPLLNAVWYLSVSLTKHAFLYNVYIFFLHLVPAACVDFLMICLGKKPKMLKMYKKIHKMSAVVVYFLTHQITFSNENTQELWRSTSDDDKKIFPFSIRDLDWDEYLQLYYVGLRRFLCKETDDMLPAARIKRRRLYYLHLLTKTILCVLVVYTLWLISCSMVKEC